MISSLLKLVKFLCLSQNMISEPFQDECHAFTVTVGAVHGWVPYKYDFCCKQPGQVPYTLKFCDIFMCRVTNMHAAHCTGILFLYILSRSLTVKHDIFVHISHIHRI